MTSTEQTPEITPESKLSPTAPGFDVVSIEDSTANTDAALSDSPAAPEKGTEIRLPKGSKKSTELSLGGATIRVKTDVTPATLKQIRELVEAKFEALADKLEKGVSAHQLTVLVAYNLAEELLLEREKLKAVKRRVLESSERLMNRVGTHLGLE